MREPSENHPIIIRYFPIIIRFSQGIYRRSSTDPKNNLPIIYRQIPRIYRSGCRNRSVESSDNRQIAQFLDRPSGPRNHQLIVNQFHVIINSAALNPSTIHQQNARIHQRAGRPPAIRSLESSDNHPTKRRNHPMESANLPMIYRRIPEIYRSSRGSKGL